MIFLTSGLEVISQNFCEITSQNYHR